MILFVAPFLFYFVERGLGILPSEADWYALSINHGPWRQEDGPGMGIESVFVLNLLLFLSIGTFIYSVYKSAKNQSAITLIFGMLLALVQFGLGMVQLYLLIWTVD